MTINFDVHRADWLAGDPWPDDSPAFPAWPQIDLIIIHWPGTNGVPTTGNPDDVLEFLRGQQRYSRSAKGYNLCYSSSVDWLGRRIEIRGDQYKNAANAPGALNTRSFSVDVLTNLDGAMTDAQVAGVTDLANQIRAAAPGATVIGHRDGPNYETGATPTACPGDPIYARIRNGDFNQTTGDDDMTPEQDAMLRKIHDAIYIDDGVMPGYPSIWTMTNRIYGAVWPNGVLDAAGNVLASVGTITKRIADKLGVPST